MPLFSMTDANTGAPKFAVASGLGVAADGSTLYANTTASEFVPGLSIGVFGVSKEEIGLANNAAQKPTHTGWVLVKQGTGSRTGRIQTEVIVAGGMSADAGGDANDNILFANT
jgi:hypothetical protein